MVSGLPVGPITPFGLLGRSDMIKYFLLDCVVLLEGVSQVSVKINVMRPNCSTYMYDMQGSWPEFSSNFINQYNNVWPNINENG